MAAQLPQSDAPTKSKLKVTRKVTFANIGNKSVEPNEVAALPDGYSQVTKNDASYQDIKKYLEKSVRINHPNNLPLLIKIDDSYYQIHDLSIEDLDSLLDQSSRFTVYNHSETFRKVSLDHFIEWCQITETKQFKTPLRAAFYRLKSLSLES